MVDFLGSEISIDSLLILLEKIDKKHKLINKFSKYLQDTRNQHLNRVRTTIKVIKKNLLSAFKSLCL